MSRRTTFIVVLAGALFPFVCGSWLGVAQPGDYVMDAAGHLLNWKPENAVYLSDRESIAIYLSYVGVNSLFWAAVFVGTGRILTRRRRAT